MNGTNAWQLMRAGVPLSLLLDIDDPALPELGAGDVQATRAAMLAARAMAPSVDPMAAEDVASDLAAGGRSVAFGSGLRSGFISAAVPDWS